MFSVSAPERICCYIRKNTFANNREHLMRRGMWYFWSRIPVKARKVNMEECLVQVTDTSNRNFVEEGHFIIMTFRSDRKNRRFVMGWGIALGWKIYLIWIICVIKIILFPRKLLERYHNAFVFTLHVLERDGHSLYGGHPVVWQYKGIQGVPRVKVTTSGDCSLCWTIPI